MRAQAVLVLSFLAASAAGTASGTHDAAFWRELAAHPDARPEGASPGDLLLEATALLGSPDPTLRDGVGYGLAAEWIVRKKVVDPAGLRALQARWTANLKVGLGETDTDTVLLRSFSALDLSLLAARDRETPYLEPAERRALLDAALAYLAGERDLRGHDPVKGWIHATAHTADLLKFLARSPSLPAEDAVRVLHGIGAKLRDAGAVFGWGEDERLASAAMAVLRRDDLDPAALAGWLDGLAAPARGLWDAEVLDERRFAAVQNAKHLLARLHVLLSVERDPPPRLAAARARVLQALDALP